MRTVLLALALAVGNLVSADAAEVAVGTCGTVVASGDTGVLQQDLDCSAAPASEPAVVLANRASLSLGGFTLTGAVDGTAVRCARHCTVRGPGTITSAPSGPGHLRAACIRALHDEGALQRSQKLKVEDLNLTGCGQGVVGDTGPRGTKLIVENVIADGNYAGFTAAGVRAQNVSVSGSGAGFNVPGGEVTGVDVHADGNDPSGVVAGRLRLKNSTANGNAAFGVMALAGATKFLDTTVTGNGIRDVVSARPPHVALSTCGTSARWISPNGLGLPWGVCSGD
jgi:hypothetical protein